MNRPFWSYQCGFGCGVTALHPSSNSSALANWLNICSAALSATVVIIGCFYQFSEILEENLDEELELMIRFCFSFAGSVVFAAVGLFAGFFTRKLLSVVIWYLSMEAIEIALVDCLITSIGFILYYCYDSASVHARVAYLAYIRIGQIVAIQFIKKLLVNMIINVFFLVCLAYYDFLDSRVV